MSGFFSSLAAKQLQLQEQAEQEQEDHRNNHGIITDDNNNNNNSSLQFLFKNNEEIYNKGFELWQQYYQLHHQKSNHNHHHHRNLTLQDFDFSVGPSSRRSSSGGGGGGGGGDDCLDYGYRSAAGFRVTTTTRQGRGGGGEGMNCQDCGNQAKKDCPHMRCRTCCKSRGYHCQTHVKSTWVPAAKRRERQQLNQLQVENPKRLREDPSAATAAGGGAGGSALACTTTSGFELGRNFPPEVSSPAEFRCVRVCGVDDAEEHLAYQTAVNIGGHLFKGILYDQGPESRYPSGGAAAGESSSGYGASQQQQLPLDLISAAAATTSNQNTIDPSINYPTPLCAFMAGTQFFPPPRQ